VGRVVDPDHKDAPAPLGLEHRHRPKPMRS
jgi:hypothetical protein